MKGPTSSRLHPLLAEIATKHGFRLPEDGFKYLEEQDCESLIDALLQELSETGLDSDDEPNQRGMEIEAIIDLVRSTAEQPRASVDHKSTEWKQ
ncbi:hypothetical protein FJU31_03440 [Stenotrophomonas cyclobalanopsidis]|uniref:Uncharacterized protein n=1 Tax=Stenotrophomonas cyclobalanopsidis TaxID=2771362 RepID=A0ABQ6T407_9GAMM|nr:hypothetical protein [Stenotrophomonas cyclobalanopsidis]KAA9003374.1 hypothetical protein FJU31_03440 [Stenotrophomonas cyclobalanopsidis]